MIFLIFSQVVMFLMNLAILVNNKLSLDFYKIYYMTLPVIFYCAFTFIFYVGSLIKTFKGRGDNQMAPYITIPALVINIVYFIIEYFIDSPNDPFWFYISTSIVQLINVLFVFAYQKQIIEKYMGNREAALNNIVSYVYLALSAGTLYACVFINIYITVILLLITSLLLTFSLSLSRVALINAKKRRYHRHSSSEQ